MRNKKRNCSLLDFICEYKVLFGISVLCIFLIIKFSEIPFFSHIPSIIEAVFSRPATPGLSSLVDGFCYSILASVVFFFIVNYLPDYKRRKQAMKVVKPVFINLHLYCKAIILMMEIAKKEQAVNCYDDIVFDKGVTYYVKRYVNNHPPTHELFNLATDCVKYSKLIENTCETLLKMSEYSFLEDSLIIGVSSIYVDSNIRGVFSSDFIFNTYSCTGCDETIRVLKASVDVMQEFFEMPTYRMEMMSDAERHEYELK